MTSELLRMVDFNSCLDPDVFFAFGIVKMSLEQKVLCPVMTPWEAHVLGKNEEPTTKGPRVHVVVTELGGNSEF